MMALQLLSLYQYGKIIMAVKMLFVRFFDDAKNKYGDLPPGVMPRPPRYYNSIYHIGIL